MTQLPLQIAHSGRFLGIGWHRPYRTGQVRRINRPNFPKGPFMDLFIEGPPRVIPPPAKASYNRNRFGLGQLDCLHHSFAPNDISGHRFLTEDVFPGLHRCFEMLGTESRRRCKNDDIHTTINHLLESIQSNKNSIRRNSNPRRIFLTPTKRAKRSLRLLHKHVSHRPQHAVRIRIQRIPNRTGSSTATTDQTDLQRVRVGFKLSRRPVPQTG